MQHHFDRVNPRSPRSKKLLMPEDHWTKPNFILQSVKEANCQSYLGILRILIHIISLYHLTDRGLSIATKIQISLFCNPLFVQKDKRVKNPNFFDIQCSDLCCSIQKADYFHLLWFCCWTSVSYKFFIDCSESQ